MGLLFKVSFFEILSEEKLKLIITMGTDMKDKLGSTSGMVSED